MQRGLRRRRGGGEIIERHVRMKRGPISRRTTTGIPKLCAASSGTYFVFACVCVRACAYFLPFDLLLLWLDGFFTIIPIYSAMMIKFYAIFLASTCDRYFKIRFFNLKVYFFKTIYFLRKMYTINRVEKNSSDLNIENLSFKGSIEGLKNSYLKIPQQRKYNHSGKPSKRVTETSTKSTRSVLSRKFFLELSFFSFKISNNGSYLNKKDKKNSLLIIMSVKIVHLKKNSQNIFKIILIINVFTIFFQFFTSAIYVKNCNSFTKYRLFGFVKNFELIELKSAGVIFSEISPTFRAKVDHCLEFV